MGHHFVLALPVPLFVVFHQIRHDVRLADIAATQMHNFHQLRVADIKQVAHASKHIVIDHTRYPTPNLLSLPLQSTEADNVLSAWVPKSQSPASAPERR